MFRRHGRVMAGRHRRADVVAQPSTQHVAAAREPDAVAGGTRAPVVDDERARLDPETRPLPLPVPVTVPSARLRPPERRLIRTG